MKKRVLILSGPTHEYFDPVRFIGNASTGKMGKALAEEALRRGMDVEFISGPVPDMNLPNVDAVSPPHPDRKENAVRTPRLHIKKIVSAEEMLAAAKGKFAAADVIIFAAAVADFQPLEKSEEKFPKVGKNISIELKPTPDIAATLCANKRKDQVALGFALQTHDGEAKAREKLISKNLDGIVLNTPATLGAESGLFTWIDKQGLEDWGSLDKADCAKRIFCEVS
ncbi:MAG: phosphopantothenoylcysteine decarboxylase [Kiritimatiellales bacterium]|jgi:phosphopantothenoylcysteine decarboxylase/phosphopantothenate--cysteine ligase